MINTSSTWGAMIRLYIIRLCLRKNVHKTIFKKEICVWLIVLMKTLMILYRLIKMPSSLAVYCQRKIKPKQSLKCTMCHLIVIKVRITGGN